MWNPETGAVTPQAVYEETKDKRTNLPVWLGPYGTAVVVFRRVAGAHVVRMERDGQEIFPKMTAMSRRLIDMRSGAMVLRATQGGHYVAVDAAGRRHAAIVAEPAEVKVAGPWMLAFTPGWGAPAEVRMDKLASWSDSSDEGVRHFSGTAAYTTEFVLPGPIAGGGARGARPGRGAGDGARLGEWQRDGRGVEEAICGGCDSAAVAGKNSLKVQVTNLWPNRIIGDQSLPEGKRFTHTNITKFKGFAVDDFGAAGTGDGEG